MYIYLQIVTLLTLNNATKCILSKVYYMHILIIISLILIIKLSCDVL